MSYCLHPTCPNPENPENQKACCTCGTKLLLKLRYRATQLSSDGKFVRTFQGLDSQTDQPIIIKQICIPSEILRAKNKKQKILDVFNKTAQTFCQLSEVTNLHAPIDFSVTGNGLYLIKATVIGETVDQLIKTHGQLREKEILKLLDQLVPVLQKLHDNQLIHRDICPKNIIYDYQKGQFLLTNLGIPQLVAESLREDVPSIGEYLVGDPSYSAPEQLNGLTASISDIYSLGMVCLQAITAANPMSLVDSQRGGEYQAYLSTNPISLHLKQIVEKMSAQSTLERYKQAQDILTDLNASDDSLIKQITSTATKVPMNLLQSGTGLVAKTFSKLPKKSKS